MRENLHHLQQQVRAFVVDGQDSDLALGEAEAFSGALIRDATLQKEIHFWGRLEPMPHSSIEDHDMTTFKEFDVPFIRLILNCSRSEMDTSPLCVPEPSTDTHIRSFER